MADDALMVNQGELILLTIPNPFFIFPGNPLNPFTLDLPRGHPMSIISRFVKLFPAVILVFLVGCSTLTPHEKEERAVEKKVPPRVVLPSETKEKTEGDNALREESKRSEEMTNQDYLDSALDYAQAANDYWERGDMDNALDALDTAYSLILNVKTDGDPDLLQQKEDLRFTISKRIVEINASRFTVAGGDHNSIPLVMNEYVRKEIESFKGP
jgi:hypothetical protein